jgi:hypothetical protein
MLRFSVMRVNRSDFKAAIDGLNGALGGKHMVIVPHSSDAVERIAREIIERYGVDGVQVSRVGDSVVFDPRPES